MKNDMKSDATTFKSGDKVTVRISLEAQCIDVNDSILWSPGIHRIGSGERLTVLSVDQFECLIIEDRTQKRYQIPAGNLEHYYRKEAATC